MHLVLDAAPLRTAPTRGQIEMVRREAAEGRFGPVQDAAVEKYWNSACNARRGAIIVGSFFAVVTLVVAVVIRDLLAVSIGVSVVATALASVWAYVTTVRGRSRAWERHSRVASFARANGLDTRLLASEEEVPDVIVPQQEQPVSVVFNDVTTGWCDGMQIGTGTRVRFTEERRETAGSGSSYVNVPQYLTWAALRPALGIAAGELAEIRRRLPDLGDVELMPSSEWVVLGVENAMDTLDRLPELLALLEQGADVFDVQDDPVGPADAVDF